jgi:cation:H+ antiporter
MIFMSRKNGSSDFLEERFLEYEDVSKAKAVLGFLLCAIVVFGAGIYVAKLADQISKLEIGGVKLGGTFVGTLFLAICTSLPETSVCVSCFFKNNMDMAVGNILGANAMNMGTLAFTDIFYRQGILLNNVGENHILTSVFIVSILFVFIAGAKGRSKKDVPGLSWDTILMGIIYIGGMYVLFINR